MRESERERESEKERHQHWEQSREHHSQNACAYIILTHTYMHAEHNYMEEENAKIKMATIITTDSQKLDR